MGMTDQEKRDLVVRLARLVGFDPWRNANNTGYDLWRSGKTYLGTVGDDGSMTSYCWNPLRKIADAWMLVEALRQRTPYQDIHIQHLQDHGWSVSCCFDKSEGGFDHFEYADTICEAICLAADKAVSA
jgi:hypothetical protein